MPSPTSKRTRSSTAAAPPDSAATVPKRRARATKSPAVTATSAAGTANGKRKAGLAPPPLNTAPPCRAGAEDEPDGPPVLPPPSSRTSAFKQLAAAKLWYRDSSPSPVPRNPQRTEAAAGGVRLAGSKRKLDTIAPAPSSRKHKATFQANVRRVISALKSASVKIRNLTDSVGLLKREGVYFGLVKFATTAGSRKRPARFLRLPHDSAMCEVHEFLCSPLTWGLDKMPSLLISVTGDAAGEKRLRPSAERDMFLALCYAASSTNAWIMDGGTDGGIMHLIGKMKNM